MSISREKVKNGVFHNLGIRILIMFMVFYTGISVIQQVEQDKFQIEANNGEEVYTNLQVGDFFQFDRLVCIEKDLVVEVSREVVNLDTKERIMLPNVKYLAVREEFDNECFDLTFITYVPQVLEPGNYYYKPTLFYKINPMKSITRPAPGVYFEVVE